MLYILKIDDYLKILTDEKMKDFVTIHFSEYFKSIIKKPNIAKSPYIFLTTPDKVENYVEIMEANSSDNCIYRDNVEVLNIFDLELQLINTKPMIKNNLKELINALKKFEIQKKLVLDYKKRNDCKILHSSVKPIAGDSAIDEAIKSMH